MTTIDHIVATLFDSTEKLWDKDSLIIGVIFAVILIETIAIFLKRWIKARIFAIQKDLVTDTENPEYYLEYYRKGQIIDIIRFAVLFVGLGTLIVTRTSIGANFFVIVAGALVITFRDFILSMVAFFIVLRRYKIGETIGIGDIQGQIISIRMFTVGLLGKDNDGDNTGRHFTIPGHKFLTETIRREELQVESIRKELIRIPYSHESYSLNFADFNRELKNVLNTMLPMITKKNCGNFQTYIGYKYKLDIDYYEDKCITITVGIIGKWRKNVERKEQIVEWTEQYRIQKPPKEY
ncbi:mechanosensitive ion channel family protein [Candidatus Gracilibacteria bacterium]|nr:mechanosensitive ion channel family protein [Candidatus Gracilibacteria bacterium]